MAGLERWHKLRVQAARNRRNVTTAAQVERSTIPVRVNRDDEVIEVDVPIPELVQEGVRAGEEADFAKQIAADAAQVAQDAQTSADGKSRVIRSTSEATAAGTYKEGDQWWQFSGADIIGLWLHDGTGWVQQVVTGQVIASLDAGKITTGVLAADRIGTNSITTAKLASTAIDGMTITGAVMRTAPSGQRMQFDVNGLRAFNVNNVETASLAAVNGQMTLNGVIKMPTGSGTPAEIGSYGISSPLFDNKAMNADRTNGFGHQRRDLSSSFGTQFGDLIANAESIYLRRRFDNLSGNIRGSFELRTYDGAEINMVSRASRTGLPMYFDIRPELTGGYYFIGGGPMSSLRFYDNRVEVRGPLAFEGDTALLPWSNFGTYGTGWSDLTATPYEGVKAQAKGGMFYLDIALKKASGHVGSEVILRINQAYRPKGPKMQYGYASGDNFVVAQPDGDIIVAIARAGAGNLTAATLAWSLT